ncbi:MAG TPA: hypothetical protein VK163_04245, partial [Opitutaceae bacterium]|nr:hypothetical protein [Opitutaceae bacterium]
TLTPKQEWLRPAKREGTTQFEERIEIAVDWQKAPPGRSVGELVLAGAGSEYTVTLPVRNEQPALAGAVENNGVVAIEAARFDRVRNSATAHWITIPNLGRTDSAVTIAPSTAASCTPGADAPRLEYIFTLLDDAAAVSVAAHVSPTQDFRKSGGLRFALAIDDGAPQIININEGEDVPDWKYPKWWNDSVADHIKIKSIARQPLAAGRHTLKVWMVDSGVVLQRFVIDAGGLKPTYLGPPASRRVE